MLFVWGLQRIVPVRVTDLTITEKLYDTALNPIHADAQIGLRVLTPDEIVGRARADEDNRERRLQLHARVAAGAGGGQPGRRGRRASSACCQFHLRGARCSFPAAATHDGRTYAVDAADGTVVRPCALPLPGPAAVMGYARRQPGQRLDLIAGQFLGDATAFWRLCDANNAVVPDALAARDLVGIPLDATGES